MFRRSASRRRFRDLEDLFFAGIVGDLSDGERLDRFVRCGDGVGEAAFDPTTNDRLDELERKLDRLLGEQDETSSIAKIGERLDALEHQVDQLLEGRKGKSP